MSNGQRGRKPVERRKPWRREIVVIAALMIVFVVVGWVKVGGFAEDLRDSAVAGCQRQNEVRGTVSRTTNTLRRLVAVSLESGPPAVTTDEQRSRRLFEAAIESLQPLSRTDCEAEYPGSPTP